MASLDFDMFQVLESLKKTFEDKHKHKEPQGIMFIDMPEHTEYIKRLVTQGPSIGADFLVISAADGPVSLSPNFNDTDVLMALLADQFKEPDNGIIAIEAYPVQPDIGPMPVEKRKDRPHFRDIEFKGKYPSLKR